ncbi:MAG: CrcB family protein [Proteobacteria bacterium]|nr:CrcB family protein [Pseudomonadota bacterium]
MFQKLLWLAVAGGAGTLCRYGLSGAVHRFLDSAFPWGTLVVNVAGCFAAGALWTLSEGFATLSGQTRVIIFIGFFGAFTTFSTFMLESAELVRAAEFAAALKNVALQNVIGIVCVAAGMMLVRSLRGG